MARVVEVIPLPSRERVAPQAPGEGGARIRFFSARYPHRPEAGEGAFHTRLSGQGPHTLRFHGLVPPAEIRLDGTPILTATSMFRRYEVPVTLDGEANLTIVSRSPDALLARKFGRARWRPKLIDTPALRGVRSTLLGHMPGWCPPLNLAGAWRPVELVAETGPLRVHAADLRAGLDGCVGTLSLTLSVEWDGPRHAAAFVEVADTRTALEWRDDTTLRADLTLPGISPWWPHTHGEPTLYPVAATVGEARIDLGRTGFRRIAVDRGPDGDGFALTVNGVPVFCRGACWVPEASLPGSREAYAPALARMVEAGMNMVRVGGTMVYEADAFHALCDELGILVWQDFMFANFDYPADPAFLEEARVEAAQFLDRTQSSPSLAVLCGGSEMEQQAAMLGLPPASPPNLWAQPLTTEVLAEEAARWRPDVPYLTNSPTGGPLPFVANAGVTHYYGVGAYRRPLEDARLAGVRFASECLAFANIPDELPPSVPAVHHPDWKRGIPRDPGASWDFEDVRDHYLELLYAVNARRLRYEEPDHYLRLSRAVSAEVMEAVFAEWRRPGSPCRGGLVWFLRDIAPGCGWGVLDSGGWPKAAWHGLKRAFRPVQVLFSDEGVNGLAVHLLNETAHTVPARLALTALRHGETPVVRAERAVTVPARGSLTIPATELAGRFFDFTYAYRFGPPAHDVTVATLLRETGGEPLAEAFHFPQGRALPRADLGLTAGVERDGEGWLLRLETRRLACSVHVEDAGFRAAESWFHLPPGARRTVRLLPTGEGELTPDGEVHAVNGLGIARYRGPR